MSVVSIKIKMIQMHIQNIRINGSEQASRAAVSKPKDIAKWGARGGTPHICTQTALKPVKQPDKILLSINM